MKKYKRKQEEVVCNTCNKSFLKDSSEVKRNLKVGRLNYCSLSCSKKTEENLKLLEKVRNKDILKLYSNNRLDEFSIFKEHLRRAKRRDKIVSITLEDLKEQWDSQKGICTYSKVELTPVGKQNNPIFTMSLDRIDSSKGYVKGNIHFISISMNLMKNSLTHEEMLENIKVLKNTL